MAGICRYDVWENIPLTCYWVFHLIMVIRLLLQLHHHTYQYMYMLHVLYNTCHYNICICLVYIVDMYFTFPGSPQINPPCVCHENAQQVWNGECCCKHWLAFMSVCPILGIMSGIIAPGCSTGPAPTTFMLPWLLHVPVPINLSVNILNMLNARKIESGLLLVLVARLFLLVLTVKKKKKFLQQLV